MPCRFLLIIIMTNIRYSNLFWIIQYKCAASKDRTNTGYNYYTPNLYQGKFEKLEVIGDKKGGATAVYNLKHPEVMDNIIKLFWFISKDYSCIAESLR